VNIEQVFLVYLSVLATLGTLMTAIVHCGGHDTFIVGVGTGFFIINLDAHVLFKIVLNFLLVFFAQFESQKWL
jgi:hypothetical protein